MASFKIIDKKPVDGVECEYEISVAILPTAVTEFRAEALRNVSESLKIDGFRPGHVPEKIITDKFGEVMVLEEAGRLALEKHYPEIIKESGVEAISSPSISITKVAAGENFELKIITAIRPEVKLASYKKLSSEVMSKSVEVKVEEKEIEEAIKELQQQIAHDDLHKGQDKNSPEANKHDHGEMVLPPVDEDFIKKFGDFKTIDEFRAKISDSIKVQKERKEREKKRLLAVDAIIEKSTIKMPRLLVDSELDRMQSEMEHQIGQMGLKMDDYLKHINKTKDDLRKAWENEAVKRAKTQIILSEIAEAEKIKPEESAVNTEVENIMKMYKDADKFRTLIFVETMLTNEKVWQFLEGQK